MHTWWSGWLYWEEGECTIVSDHIVHLTSGIIAVLVRVEESSLATDTRETAQCAETCRTSADDDDIVVGLGDGGSRDGRAGQGKSEREELGEEHLGLTAEGEGCWATKRRVGRKDMGCLFIPIIVRPWERTCCPCNLRVQLFPPAPSAKDQEQEELQLEKLQDRITIKIVKIVPAG